MSRVIEHPRTGTGGGIPRWVWIAAVLAALFHMLPYAVAAVRTPPGWSFIGNVSSSPDYMQYRTWARQTQVEGPIVSDRFTAEPNGKFLPVPFYWAVGKVATVTGLTPEWSYAWLGVPLAVVMVLLLYAAARRFLRVEAAIPWVVGTILLGGGLGALLVVIQETPMLRQWYPFAILVVQPLEVPGRFVLFERQRGHYVVQALLDTHFLLLWVIATAAVLALADVVLDFSRRRLAWMLALFAGATILHIYEGITLMAITAGVVGVGALKGLPRRTAAVILLSAGTVVGACLVWALGMQRTAGFPMPSWSEPLVTPLILLLAFPVVWLLVATGGRRFWEQADQRDAFLVGWALGCLAFVMAGPFMPYSNRGIMTLQIPLVLIGGVIYFSDRARVRASHVALLVMLSSPTLALRVMNMYLRRFTPDAAHAWVQPAHTRVIAALAAHSGPADLLLADEESLRWLGPEYVGRHYAGHFFLTIRYDQKRAALEAFFDAKDPVAQERFLRESAATLLFVPSRRNPDHLQSLPMLTPIIATDAGVLFAVKAGTPDAH